MTDERKELISNLFKSGKMLASDWTLLTYEEKMFIIGLGESKAKQEREGFIE